MSARRVNKDLLQDLAAKVHKHANVRIGDANSRVGVKVGFYIGPNEIQTTETKREMYYYLLGLNLGRTVGKPGAGTEVKQ